MHVPTYGTASCHRSKVASHINRTQQANGTADDPTHESQREKTQNSLASPPMPKYPATPEPKILKSREAWTGRMRRFESFLSSVDLRASNGTHPIQHSRIDQDSTEVTRRPLTRAKIICYCTGETGVYLIWRYEGKCTTDEADLSSNFSNPS